MQFLKKTIKQIIFAFENSKKLRLLTIFAIFLIILSCIFNIIDSKKSVSAISNFTKLVDDYEFAIGRRSSRNKATC